MKHEDGFPPIPKSEVYHESFLPVRINKGENMSESYIDKLVNQNGNWYLHFCYGNYGYNTLFILPSFTFDDDELERNQSLVGMCDDVFELDFIIESFIRGNPRSPFITRRKLFSECVDSLNEKLNEMIIDNDYTKFIESSIVFDRFLKACKMIMDDSTDKLMYDAHYQGWESILPPEKIRKKFDKSYPLLHEMYEDEFYPNHLVDVLKEQLKEIIILLEDGETDTNIIQTKFDIIITNIRLMEESFNKEHSEIETVARDSIYVSIEYILKWFNISIDVETAMRNML